jgi:8-oxo-dGTP pyrophosphatase MutT (NUDIX family)
MWECVGGAALAGEDSLTAALRETKEEVGVELSPQNGKLAYSAVGRVIDGVKIRDILDAWIFKYDGEADLHNATTAEVAQIKWMNCDEIQALFQEEKFVHTLAYFFTEIKDK